MGYLAVVRIVLVVYERGLEQSCMGCVVDGLVAMAPCNHEGC